ncbi:MAG TPA: hypothetical protein VFX84_02245 [Candidatus Saccharimonadales bacterium]|nr:hypothetical protein [Candidatus Saccharimonadales bacterium]
MPKEAFASPADEPVLSSGAAATLLLMSRRAVEAGGRLFRAEARTDSIGRAAFAVYEGEFEGTLSEAIEEVTGSPPTMPAATLKELVAQSMIQHAVELGMPEDEAVAQIAV